jgi:hypothetical protein
MCKDFSLLQSVQTGSLDHPASVQWVLAAPSLGTKRPECESDHCSPSIEVKNGGAIPPVLIRHHGVVLKHRDNFTFTIQLSFIKSTI